MTKLTWLGQEIDYEPNTNTVRTTIRQPFWKASEMLGWSGKSAGIGINTKIIDFIKSKQADLIVTVEEPKGDWHISYLALSDFIKQNTTTYNVKGGKTKLNVIAWDCFKGIEFV